MLRRKKNLKEGNEKNSIYFEVHRDTNKKGILSSSLGLHSNILGPYYSILMNERNFFLLCVSNLTKEREQKNEIEPQKKKK